VEVELPAGAGAQLEAVSSRGSVSLAPGFGVPGQQSEDRIDGPLNGGGRSLRLYTARGNVNVRPR
jgi:hypothetical protein